MVAAKKPSGVLGAAQSGDRRVALEAVRNRLAAAMDAAPDAVVAQVAAQLRATLLELSALGNDQEVSLVDDLAGRRRTRRADAKAGISSG